MDIVRFKTQGRSMLTRPTRPNLSLFNAFGDPNTDLIHLLDNTSQEEVNIILMEQIWGDNVLHLAACKQDPVTFQAVINSNKISQESLIAALLERDHKGRSAFHLVAKFQDFFAINSLLALLSPFTINELLQYITNETIPFCIDNNIRLSQNEKENIKQTLQNITQFTQKPAESMIKYSQTFITFLRVRLPGLNDGTHVLKWLELLNTAARAVDKLNSDDVAIKDQFYACLGRANYNAQMKVTVYPKTSKYLDGEAAAYSKITSLNNITLPIITTEATTTPEIKEMEDSNKTITLSGDSLAAFLKFGVITGARKKVTMDLAPSQETSAAKRYT